MTEAAVNHGARSTDYDASTTEAALASSSTSARIAHLRDIDDKLARKGPKSPPFTAVKNMTD